MTKRVLILEVSMLLLSAYVLSPYLNNFFLSFNLTIICTIMILPVSVYGYLFLNKQTEWFYLVTALLIFILTMYLPYAQYSGFEKYLKLLAIIVVPGVALFIHRLDIEHRFFKWLQVLCAISILYAFSDVENFIRAMIAGSRSVYGINPLNISNLGAIMLITSIFFNFKDGFKTHDVGFYILGIVALIASGSKGPLLAFFIVLILIMIRNYQRLLKLKFIILVSIVVIAIIIALLFFRDEYAIIQRLIDMTSGNNQSSISTRQKMYIWTLNEILKNPLLLGSGIDVFNEHYSYARYPHNIVLEVAYEVGSLVAFVFYGLLFLTAFIIFYNKAPLSVYMLIFLLVAAQFSHDVTFLRNIILMAMLASLCKLRKYA